MTAHDHATGTSWAVIDRPYNSDASRLFLLMSAHSKFLEIRRSECTPAKIHRHLALLAAVPGGALHQHGRFTGVRAMCPLRHLLALPGAGVYGRQYAREC